MQQKGYGLERETKLLLVLAVDVGKNPQAAREGPAGAWRSYVALQSLHHAVFSSLVNAKDGRPHRTLQLQMEAELFEVKALLLCERRQAPQRKPQWPRELAGGEVRQADARTAPLHRLSHA
jgi:hypothetical protein